MQTVMHCVDTSPKLSYKQTQFFVVSEHAAKLLNLYKKRAAYALQWNVSEDKNDDATSGRNNGSRFSEILSAGPLHAVNRRVFSPIRKV